ARSGGSGKKFAGSGTPLRPFWKLIEASDQLKPWGAKYAVEFVRITWKIRTSRQPVLPWSHDVWGRLGLGSNARRLLKDYWRLSGARRQLCRYRKFLYQGALSGKYSRENRGEMKS